MPKRVTSQDGKIELIIDDTTSDIDIGNDVGYTGSVNVGTNLAVDGATGTVAIQTYDSLANVSTTPGGTPVSDPNFGSVVFLASFENAAANATTYTPEIGGVSFEWLNHSGATEPTQVDGQIETAQSKFGTKSIYAKETAGAPTAGWQTTALTAADYLSFAGDFTIEMHVYIVDNTSEIPLMAFGDFNQYKWELTLEGGTGRLNFRTSSNGTVFSGPLSQEAWGGGGAGFTTGSWQHLAICRSGDDWYAWKDGVLMDGGVNAGIALTIQNSIQGYLCILQEGQNDGAGTIECYIDNIRITDGVARYTTGFTPPAAPYEGSGTEEVLTIGSASHARVDIAAVTSVNINATTSVTFNGSYLDIQEIADPAFGADAARAKIWVRDDAPNTLVFTDDAGTDFDVAGAGVIQNRTYTDVAYSTPPSGDTPTGSWQIWDADNTDQLATFGYEADPELLIKNYIRGSDVEIRGIDVVGTEKTMAYFQVDGPTTLYNNGTAVAATTGSGIEARGIVASLPSAGLPQATQYVLANSGGSDVGYLRFPSTENLTVDNLNYGGNVTLRATPGVGGALVNMFRGDPDGAASLYYDGTEVARTITAATGGLESNNTLTGGGFERVLTVSDLGGTSKITATVQTTDATVTELISVAVASGTGYGFRINVMGTEDSTGDTVFLTAFGAIRNQGGTTGLVGNEVIDRTDDSGATAWVIAIAADDGTDALTVDVTGEASHTIDWKCSIELLEV